MSASFSPASLAPCFHPGEEVVDDRDTRAAEEADLLAAARPLLTTFASRALDEQPRHEAGEVRPLILLEHDGVDVREALRVVHAIIEEDELLGRRLRGGLADVLLHIEGAADDDIVVLRGGVREARPPLVLVIAEFNRLHRHAEFGLRPIHAALAGIEERLIAEVAVRDVRDIQFLAGVRAAAATATLPLPCPAVGRRRVHARRRARRRAGDGRRDAIDGGARSQSPQLRRSGRRRMPRYARCSRPH